MQQRPHVWTGSMLSHHLEPLCRPDYVCAVCKGIQTVHKFKWSVSSGNRSISKLNTDFMYYPVKTDYYYKSGRTYDPCPNKILIIRCPLKL